MPISAGTKPSLGKRALLVGAGGMGRAWARQLASEPGIALCGWVDRDAEILARAIEETGLANTPSTTSTTEAIAGLGPDFVVDATTPESHSEVTIMALEHGLPVLGEKPMAASMAAARAMVAASERAGRLYMVSQSRRYNSGLRTFERVIRESIGALGMLNADFYLGPHFGGFRDAMESPLIVDMAIHTFDAARFLAEADPLSVYAEEFNPSWSWYAGAACATTLFTFSNGVRFAYRGSWCAEGMPTSWEAEWRAVGAEGTARWDGASAPEAERVVGEAGFLRECKPAEVRPATVEEGIAGSLKEFLEALDSGAAPSGECHDNIKSLAMVFGAVESARRGTRVDLDEILVG